MQTSPPNLANAPMARCFAPTFFRTAAFLTVACLAAAPATLWAQLQTTDGDLQILELPLGTDLYIATTALAPEQKVDVTLLDWADQVILSQVRTADDTGELSAQRLWFRTGIGGCSCEDLGPGYPFKFPADADYLVGLAVTVRLTDTQTGDLLAERVLPIIEPQDPLIYTADLRSCPADSLNPDDSLTLVSEGPTPTAKVFLLAHRNDWQPGMAIDDVRLSWPEGQILDASEQGWNAMLWQGIDTFPGKFDVLIRWADSRGGFGDPRIDNGDTILQYSGDKGGPTTGGGGLVIDDWGCHGDGSPI